MSKRKMSAATMEQPDGAAQGKRRLEPLLQRLVDEGQVETAMEAMSLLTGTGSFAPPEERRHQALLRMLGHVKDAIASRLDELPTRRDLYRAMALAGYNSSPNPNISGEDPGLKAIWAKDDAEALLALGSEDETI